MLFLFYNINMNKQKLKYLKKKKKNKIVPKEDEQYKFYGHGKAFGMIIYNWECQKCKIINWSTEPCPKIFYCDCNPFPIPKEETFLNKIINKIKIG